jgi:hypothetical protein
VLQAVLCLSTHRQRIIKECAIKQRTIKECIIKECVIEQSCVNPHIELVRKSRATEPRIIERLVAIKECAIEQSHIELLCKSRATEPRIIESFATERHTMSFFEPCLKLRTVLYLKSWAIIMCATLFSSKLRSNPCAKLDINLLCIELCIVMRIAVSFRYQEWS